MLFQRAIQPSDVPASNYHQEGGVGSNPSILSGALPLRDRVPRLWKDVLETPVEG